uniref:Uncharacterized protein n=1 Tax=Tanacetum cinerariifolium TaxID=118510 RepID=A0A6L2K972_TANCI|nr:hypothetical protein [Tanacetum cinerariifolium]
MSKSDFSTEPTLCPQHIDEFDFKKETSLSKYDEKEQNVLYYNDLFPFNIIYPDDLKLDKGNDDNEIDMIQFSRGNENTQWSNELLKASHDKINKFFIINSFVTELNVNILAWNYFVNEMLFNLIKNLYVPFGIPFDPKWYYKDGDCARTLQRPRIWPRDEDGIHWGQWAGGVYESRLEEEMAKDGFRAYWLGSKRVIPNKGDLSDYWVEISSGRDFLRGAPSYTYIRDLVLRLCHRLISYIISRRGRHLKRKSGAMLSEGHFIGHLARHFGLVGDDGLRGLSAVACELSLIDMERQQAPQPPPPPLVAGRTMPQRLGRIDEEIQGLRRNVRSLRGLVESSMTDQGSSPAVFERRTRQRTDEASTSVAPQQPDL